MSSIYDETIKSNNNTLVYKKKRNIIAPTVVNLDILLKNVKNLPLVLGSFV